MKKMILSVLILCLCVTAFGGSVLAETTLTEAPAEMTAEELYQVGNDALDAEDYTPYFDDVMLDRMINEWFEEQALAPAA